MKLDLGFSNACRSLATWGGLAASLLLTTQNARAEKFSNAFIEFEKPANWTCLLEGAEFVCQSNDATKKKEAIIVFAAKLKGDQDSLKQYLDYLDAAKTYPSASGRNVKSEKKYARKTNLREHPWIDALHFESEIPGYYTRYVATLYKEEIGVLVTYSVAKDKYQEYTRLFEPMVNSLTVFRKGNTGINEQTGNGLPQVNIPRAMDGGLFPTGQTVAGGAPEKAPSEGSGSGGGGAGPLLLLVLLGGAVFVFLKKKKG